MIISRDDFSIEFLTEIKISCKTEIILTLVKENKEMRDTLVTENKELRNQISELITKVFNINEAESTNLIEHKGKYFIIEC